MRPFRPVEPGGILSASELTATADRAYASATEIVGPPLERIPLANGGGIWMPDLTGAFCRITGGGPAGSGDPPPYDYCPPNCYSGVQIISDTDGTTVDAGLEFHCIKNPLVAIDGNTSLVAGDIVFAWPSPKGSHFDCVVAGASLGECDSGSGSESSSGSGSGCECDALNVEEFFRHRNNQCQIRPGCLVIVDSQGRVVNLHLEFRPTQ